MGDGPRGNWSVHANESNLDDDLVARLVKAGGEGSDLSDARAKRISEGVYASWQSAVNIGLAKRRNRRTFVGLGAVAIMVFAVFVSPTSRPLIDPSTIVAEVVVVQGRVTHTDSAEGLSLGSFVHPGQGITTSAHSGLSFALGQRRSLRLGQSSILKVHGPNEFELVDGVLYYDSHHSDVGIRVRTSKGIVSDIGTQFEVRSSSDRLAIRVREGEINLDVGNWFVPSQRVSVGEELIIEDEGTTRKNSFSHGDDWLWAQSLSPNFELEGSTLDEALSWIARESGWKLRYANQRLRADAREFVLHGSVNGLSQTEALKLVTEITSVVYVLDGGELTISE